MTATGPCCYHFWKMIVGQRWTSRHTIGTVTMVMLVVIATVVGVVANNTGNGSENKVPDPTTQCTGLPFTWSEEHLRTTPHATPLEWGATMGLSCEEGWRNRGDTVVTCQGGTRYGYTVQPHCQADSDDETILRGELDERNYRAVTLSNKMRVTLVSDSTTELSAVNLRIPAGSWVNPKEIPGLMHYLEHMLFLGSTKYTGASEYVKHISDNGGRRNGATGFTYTYYYFKIFNHAWTKAAKMLANFVSCPLIAADKLESALLAVNSEYIRNFGKSSRTLNQLIYLSADPAHPYNGFSTGSISTLNRTDIQERLWEFYDRYYSANLITVAIIGNETLDTLQQWAEEIFTAIPNKDKTKPVFNMLPFPPGNKDYISRRVYYQPKSDKDSIKFIFPVNIRDYPNLSYLTYLLGYEGKGSLYQYLSTRGYITTLSSSISVEAQHFVLVSVYCDLTEKGLRNPKFIVEALFQFIKRVNDEGVNEQLWQENKRIDELRFKFKEKEDPAAYASTISAHMARVTDPRDYLDPPSRRIYNESLELEIMSYITPHNFNMYLSSLKLSTDEETVYGPQLNQEEKWYTTPYENIPIKDADIDNWKNVELEVDLHLPETNPFIPDDFNMRDYEGRALPVTVNASEVSDMTVWWYQDAEFSQPKIYLGCRVQPSPKTPTVRNALLSEMLKGVFLRETSESLYPAVSVDYSIAISFDNFWVLLLSGFSDEDKVKKVIEKGLDSLFKLNFDQDVGHFNATVREPIRKEYLNIKNWMPATLTRRYARMLQDEYLFDYPAALDVIDTLTQSDVRDLRDNFLKDISIDCSIMGNVDSTQAANYAELVKNKLVTGAGGAATITKEDRLGDYTYPVYKLPLNRTLVIRQKVMNPDEPNSGVLTQFQIGPSESNGPYTDKPEYTRYVLVTLLELMMREPCFNYLRTQQQLGYVASCFQEKYKDILLFNILVQGSRADAGALVIAQEHDKFINLQYDKFEEQSKSEEGKGLWQDIKVALRKQIEEKPISLSEKNSQFNIEIFSPTRDFARKAKKVKALETITMEDFLGFYKRYLMSDQRRKISAQVYGKDHEVPDTVDADKGEVLIRNIEEYRETLTERFQDDE